MKREEKIKQAATLARAEKEGLMASSFSKLNSEIRHKDDGSEEVSGLPLAGKKRPHKDMVEDERSQ